MRIGIFGGSFNPPHLMHKNIALELIDKGYLDKVIYVPTGNLYPKANLVSDKDRYEMVRLIIGINKVLDVSNYEFGRRIFTYQTLNYFKEQYPNDEIYFICGSDNLKELDTWKNYQYILANFKVLVIKRDNDNVPEILNKYIDYREHIIVPNIIYDSISSTEIRFLLKNDRQSKRLVKKLTSDTLKYIYQNNLYR